MSGGFCGHCMDEPCSCDMGQMVQKSVVLDLQALTAKVERLEAENFELRKERADLRLRNEHLDARWRRAGLGP